ncbi:MAG: helix-turn-helix transcriptional regulator, partial [Clostridia bacterium]
MTFGNKLQTLRKQKGLSQEELADILQVSRQAISKWELDETLPEIGKIVAIANYFDVTTDF